MRNDWSKQYYIYNGKLNLSTNVCIDKYNINVNLDVTKYNDAYASYNILSNYYNVDIKNIAIGLGLSELIIRLLQFLKINKLSLSVLDKPTWQPVELYQNILNIKHGNDVAYIASPNGNTGSICNIDEILKKFKLVILDEAYGDFYKKIPACYSERVIILKTLSKSYSLPGARFAWCFASNEIINTLQELRPAHITIGNIDNYLKCILNDIEFHVERMNETKMYIENKFCCSNSNGNFVIFNKKYKHIRDNFIIKDSRRMALINLETFKKIEHNI